MFYACTVVPAKPTKRENPDHGAWAGVYRIVRRIPRGRVMNYGQIAEIVEPRLSARAVGWAMHGCPEDVPWHRVVNASGGCSTDEIPGVPRGLQQSLLAEEGVEFRPSGRLDLKRYRWTPPPPDAKRAAGKKKTSTRR